MNIEVIPNNWHKNQDIPTPVMVVCEKCCRDYGLKEGASYSAWFLRYSFFGTIGSMNVINHSSVQKCINCKSNI